MPLPSKYALIMLWKMHKKSDFPIRPPVLWERSIQHFVLVCCAVLSFLMWTLKQAKLTLHFLGNNLWNCLPHVSSAQPFSLKRSCYQRLCHNDSDTFYSRGGGGQKSGFGLRMLFAYVESKTFLCRRRGSGGVRFFLNFLSNLKLMIA